MRTKPSGKHLALASLKFRYGLPHCNHLKGPTTATYQVIPDIAAHLVSLLHQAGGRMPLAQVLKKLPAGITTSEQQIRKLAQKHAQIEIKGPLLVLIN